MTVAATLPLVLFIASAMLMLVVAETSLGRRAPACPHCGTRSGEHSADCPWSRRA